MSDKPFCDLTYEEAIRKINRIISGCYSEKEVRKRLKEELGLGHVHMTSRIPTDQKGREARDLLVSLGGPVMANGAVVILEVYGPSGRIIP